jgi:ElaB/YqjD/DUF883 family membrane-anchored ribosome-binding protein
MKSKLMDSISADVSDTRDQFLDELHSMVKDAEELLHTTASHTGEGAAAARARVQKSLHVVKERIDETEAAVIKSTKQAVKVTDQYVHDNPWKSIGISACVGAIVGMLIARR